MEDKTIPVVVKLCGESLRTRLRSLHRNMEHQVLELLRDEYQLGKDPCQLSKDDLRSLRQGLWHLYLEEICQSNFHWPHVLFERLGIREEDPHE